jgi:F0F1-type ATP synthase assembly protein I
MKNGEKEKRKMKKKRKVKKQKIKKKKKKREKRKEKRKNGRWIFDACVGFRIMGICSCGKRCVDTSV